MGVRRDDPAACPGSGTICVTPRCCPVCGKYVYTGRPASGVQGVVQPHYRPVVVSKAIPAWAQH